MQQKQHWYCEEINFMSSRN